MEQRIFLKKFLMIERALLELYDVLIDHDDGDIIGRMSPGFREDMEEIRDDIKRMEDTREL